MTLDEMLKEFAILDEISGAFLVMPKDGKSEQPPALNRRSDLQAFLLLDSLVPGTYDMVACAEHDQIWLDVDVNALAAVVTKEQIVELQRCGVWYDSDTDSLSMFV